MVVGSTYNLNTKSGELSNVISIDNKLVSRVASNKCLEVLLDEKLTFETHIAVTDLGEGPGGPGPPLFWVKKEEMTEGKMAAMASKSRPPPPPPPFSSRSGSATVLISFGKN